MTIMTYKIKIFTVMLHFKRTKRYIHLYYNNVKYIPQFKKAMHLKHLLLTMLAVLIYISIE